MIQQWVAKLYGQNERFITPSPFWDASLSLSIATCHGIFAFFPPHLRAKKNSTFSRVLGTNYLLMCNLAYFVSSFFLGVEKNYDNCLGFFCVRFCLISTFFLASVKAKDKGEADRGRERNRQKGEEKQYK